MKAEVKNLKDSYRSCFTLGDPPKKAAALRDLRFAAALRYRKRPNPDLTGFFPLRLHC
jgi:hypothetical protein